MNSDHSISVWLNSLEHNDDEAAREIWNKFHKRLIGVAMKRLRGSPNRGADADGVVNEAFASFFRRFENGNYPNLKDRDGLWRLLLTITENKVRYQMRHDLAKKRGAGRVRGESVFKSPAEASVNAGFDRLASAEPTAEEVATFNDTFTDLLHRLTDEQREVAILRMQSYSTLEISKRLDRSMATVERRLRQIREAWSNVESIPD